MNVRQLIKSLYSISPFILLGMLPPVMQLPTKPILLTMIPMSVLYIIIVYIPILVYGPNAAKTLNFPLVTSIDSVNITCYYPKLERDIKVASLITNTGDIEEIN
ncbi:hypothetical protein [Paenibacillus sp. R14(2021)]|uniref:hypothetical protein n=1 Tax=Paenibacillus sp. R14(2021) TaxID=2859228 RepID=UPI001C611DF1|nr:hypothetical protein [Paenibacillus sp. R14(2021)]